MPIESQTCTLRRATEADIPALTEITGNEEVYQKRLIAGGGSHHPENCVMVVEEAGRIIGHVFVVFVRPTPWPDADDTTRLPFMSSLWVREGCRNRGVGTYLIGAVEKEVKSRGHTRVYLSVDPVDNQGAHLLYLRLGYEPLQTEPYRYTAKYTDSNGVDHEDSEWRVDMVRDIH